MILKKLRITVFIVLIACTVQAKDLIVSCKNGQLVVWQSGKKEKKLNVSCLSASLSKAGNRVVVIKGKNLFLVNPETGKSKIFRHTLKPLKDFQTTVYPSRKALIVLYDTPQKEILSIYNPVSLKLLKQKQQSFEDGMINNLLPPEWETPYFSFEHKKLHIKTVHIKGPCKTTEEIYYKNQKLTDSGGVIRVLAKSAKTRSTYPLFYFQDSGLAYCGLEYSIVTANAVLYGITVTNTCGDGCHSENVLVLHTRDNRNLIWTGSRFKTGNRIGYVKTYNPLELRKLLEQDTGEHIFVLSGHVFDYNGHLLKYQPGKFPVTIIKHTK